MTLPSRARGCILRRRRVNNLLSDRWKEVDSYELRLLLEKHFGGPGQYDGRLENPNKFYLPLAREKCQIALTYRDERIVAIEPGAAFDGDKWNRSSKEIEESLLDGPAKVGREYSFSSYRVRGSWRGARSGVQILPPPDNAPRAPVEMAEHPFILEFPIKSSDHWPLTNYRRIRAHRRLTRLLNLLLAGSTSVAPPAFKHFWATDTSPAGRPESKWVQRAFFADLGPPVVDELSSSASEKLEELEPGAYFTEVGHDGRGLCLPADLDDLICSYSSLNERNRDKFDRAAFWMDMASCQWGDLASSSFAFLVTACESLTERGSIHRVYCEQCKGDSTHEVPGATESFRAFFETFAPGASLRKRRTQMYALRSGILHGNELMLLDQNRVFGWDPPGSNQTDLHRELWSLTRMAARNWLKSPNSSAVALTDEAPQTPVSLWARLWKFISCGAGRNPTSA